MLVWVNQSGSRRQAERLAEKRQVGTTKASTGTTGKRSSLKAEEDGHLKRWQGQEGHHKPCR